MKTTIFTAKKHSKSSDKTKFQKFSSKTGPLQVLFFLVELIAIIISIVLIISVYILTLPEVELVAITIPQNPRDTIDLRELPNIKINMNVIGYVSNRNLIPLPITMVVSASLNSDDPADRIIFGNVNNEVLMPLKKQVVVVPVVGNLNLFDSRSRNLRIVLDSCGVTSEEPGRKPIIFNIYADAYLGYGVLSIYLKTLNFKSPLPCPIIESSFGTVALGAISDLLD